LKLFSRTDGRTAEDDARDASQRETARAAELEKNVTVDASDYEYAAGLSPLQLSEAYQASPEFARKYRKLMKEYGFKPVPTFSKTGGLR
jgi:hypothetical protein